ncbi:MAG TPA: hypothetical protein VFY44_05730, partial [Thermoleophilaceae bacterium]|nr:hypothetical protein [Thermoleophilaceae bacterium]
CSRDCSLQVTVELSGTAGATRAPKARTTLRAGAGPGRGFVVRLPKAAQRRLSRSRSPGLTVRLLARSGSESRALTRQVRLRR